MKIIFLSNPSVGHTNFLISLASKALDDKHEVLFLLPGIKNQTIKKLADNPILNIDQKLSKNKIPYELMPMSLRQMVLAGIIPFKKGLEEVLFAIKIFSAASRKYYNFLLEKFSQNKPDVIIYDYTFFPAVLVSEKLNIPRVAIYHSGLVFKEFPIPAVGSDYKYNECTKSQFEDSFKELVAVEKKLKTKYEKILSAKIDTNFILSPSSKTLNLINSIKEAEYERKKLDSNVFFSGTGIYGRNEDKNFVFFTKKNKINIYISLGTVFNKNDKIFTRIINSIKIENTQILVSAGSSYKKLKQIHFNENVQIEKDVPQLRVLKKTDIFITHGGKNSINEAIKFGVPMIVFPVGGEQEYNAKLLEYLNVGIDFKEKQETFGDKEMSRAIEFILNDKEFGSSVMLLKEKQPKEDGTSLALKKILEIIR